MIKWEEVAEKLKDKNPIFLVGAGFPLGVAKIKNESLPSTGNLISKTANLKTNTLVDTTVHNKNEFKFPLIKAFNDEFKEKKTRLDDVWTFIDKICKKGLAAGNTSFLTTNNLLEKAKKTYQSFSETNPMRALFDYQYSRTGISPDTITSIILGVELKRMLAFQYDQDRLSSKLPDAEELKNSEFGTLVKDIKPATWISLNYDLVLEKVLEDLSKYWSYAFDSLIPFCDLTEKNNESKLKANHQIVKPHGSLNLWFKSVLTDNQPTSHQIYFAKKDRLTTCEFNKIGYQYKNDRKIREELRPLVIGYLPDALKDETNSPGSLADVAHDFCKWNLTHASLSLQKATAIVILGYSLPVEDFWMWSRLASIPNKDIPVFVASRDGSDGIVDRLIREGFSKAKKIKEGSIE